MYDKDFAELSGELSGAICLKTLILLGSAHQLFRKFFGTVHAIFWLWVFFLESAKIPFTLPMSKTKTMVLVFGFSFPFSPR